MRKGSLTVFVALVMVAAMTLLFAMSECIRVYELSAFSREYTDMAVESAFSEYNPYLWANYGILALDLGYGSEETGTGRLEKRVLDFCSENADIDHGYNFARLTPDDCRALNYSLLTDDGADGVVIQGIKAAEEGLISQIIEGVQEKTDSIGGVEAVDVEKLALDGDKAISEAKQKLENDKNAAATDDDPDTNPDDYPTPGEVEDNPIDAFKKMREALSTGVLSMVTSTENLSDSSIILSDMPSHRSLNTGNRTKEAGMGLLNKALFTDYLITDYGCFTNNLKHDGMKYEVEYLLSGKESDVQSLAAVVEELMLIREAANYATILSNGQMVAQAEAIAATLAGFTMNPAIVAVAKYAIMAAWAYIESVLDIRLLLSGGKVPVVKTIDEWTSDVWHLSSFFDVNAKAKQCRGGISYKDYLIGFLALKPSDTLAMRACDIMENALNSTDDYKNLKLDNMLYAADISIGYSSKEMFTSLFSKGAAGGYVFEKEKNISY